MKASYLRKCKAISTVNYQFLSNKLKEKDYCREKASVYRQKN